MSGEVRYGTAGWSFADWYGPFYPSGKADAEGPGSLFTGVLERPPDPDVGLAKRTPLAYYARFFDCVEVNSSFYGIPAVKTTEGWLDLTEGGARPFLFSLKLPMPFTHHGAFEPREVEAFRACVEPIAERGRLAGLLAQFPQSFAWSEEAARRLERIREAYPTFPLVVEVRHRSWQADRALDLLRDLSASLASIDQPQGRNTLPPGDALTNPALAYVRLHGRNHEAWFNPKAGRDAKYDYLYDASEVGEWGRRIEGFAGQAQRTLVIANNHFRGQAPANALELRALREPGVRVPAPLKTTYERLGRLS